MKTFGKMAAAVGLGLVFSVAVARSQDFMKQAGPPGAGPRCGERLVQSLELTTAQQTALDALQEETAEAIHPILEQLHALRQQIGEAAAAPSADPCAVGAMEIDAAGLHAKIDALRKSAEARFVAGLSSDQKSLYDQHVAVHPDCLAIGGGGGFFFKRLP